jgi:alkylation response protein AidB-like acyl-CoA dehydrogenase
MLTLVSSSKNNAAHATRTSRLMDVRHSPEQRALRESAAHVAERLGPHTVEQLDDDDRAAKLDAAIAASGWRELRTSADAGAPLASGVEAAIIAEELGRGLADAPFAGPTLAAELRRIAGAPPAVSPETVALTADLSSPVRAADGAVPPAIGVDAQGASSALVLVPASGGDGLGEVALLPAKTRVDLTRPAAALDPSASVSEVADQSRLITSDDVARWTALGLAIACADLVGVMRGALQLTTDYARDRRQFGAPIGSFQAIQHMLADAHMSMEGSRSVALHAAWAADALTASDALAAAAVAKAYCGRAARAVCETAIQVHGGIGNTWECLAHVFLRRALLSTDILGGIGASLARVLDHHGIGGAHELR